MRLPDWTALLNLCSATAALRKVCEHGPESAGRSRSSGFSTPRPASHSSRLSLHSCTSLQPSASGRYSRLLCCCAIKLPIHDRVLPTISAPRQPKVSSRKALLWRFLNPTIFSTAAAGLPSAVHWPRSLCLLYWARSCAIDRFISRKPLQQAPWKPTSNHWQWSQTPPCCLQARHMRSRHLRAQQRELILLTHCRCSKLSKLISKTFEKYSPWTAVLYDCAHHYRKVGCNTLL